MFKLPPTFNEFYSSLKTYTKDTSCDNNETFGRFVKQSLYIPERGMNKIMSHEDLLSCEKNASYSPTFEDADTDYSNMDASTMASFSSKNSMSSFGSGLNLNLVKKKAAKKNKKACNKKAKKGEPNYRIKYKTEVCKFWAETGYCEFGTACAFAHGQSEVRQKSHISSNYKTKKCVQFHEQGYCPYGVRCQFIHSARLDAQLRTIIENATYEDEVENAEFWCVEDPDCMCLKRGNKPRLAVFEKLANGECDFDKKSDFSEDEGIFDEISRMSLC